MAIVTRCPACNTVFRVAPPQLQARNGMVRCGRCLTVFNGFKTLSTAEPAATEETAAEPAVAETALPGTAAPAATEPVSAAPESTASGISAPASATPAPATPSAEAFRLEPVSATELAAAAVASGEIQPARSYGVEETKDFGPAPEQLTLEDRLFLEDTREAKARSARWWAAGAALVLLALAAQVAYFYRGEIAAHYPGMRPQLTRLCEAIGCVINLPQRPQLIAIEASDLQATDPARPAVIQLTATVRNHAGYDVGFPALDLVLTNSRDHTLARRIFQPREYLEPGRDARAGIPPKGEMTINLDLDTADLRPAGFRLDLMAASPQ
ncbi:MAG TPA: DUF3426 domain-containing protein [Burkholderiales bacterium]|nr:DUF3426 domain-containing protein [Burkholderiales bacterium]